MYIARTSEVVTTNDGLEIKFYILDEDNDYRNMGGVRLTFPPGTSMDVIQKSIVASLKNKYIKDKGGIGYKDNEIIKAGLQSIKEPVKRFQDKLNGIS